MTTRNATQRDQQRLARLLSLIESLPQSEAAPVGQGHMALTVRGKTFAYYLHNHHGDGIVCVCAKAAKGRQAELLRRDPRRYLVPAYLGVNGWVSLRLDLPRVDWAEVLELMVEAYRLKAPRRLAAEME